MVCINRDSDLRYPAAAGIYVRFLILFHDQYVARAFQLPEVQLEWQFARYPSIRESSENGRHIVDFAEHRFSGGSTRGPQPFSYRVIFDDAGHVLDQGWQADGMLIRRVHVPVPNRAEHEDCRDEVFSSSAIFMETSKLSERVLTVKADILHLRRRSSNIQLAWT